MNVCLSLCVSAVMTSKNPGCTTPFDKCQLGLAPRDLENWMDGPVPATPPCKSMFCVRTAEDLPPVASAFRPFLLSYLAQM